MLRTDIEPIRYAMYLSQNCFEHLTTPDNLQFQQALAALLSTSGQLLRS